MDLQEGLPVVVRDRETGGVRVLAGRAIEVADGLVPADRPVGRTGDHVHDVAVGRHEIPFRRLQRTPDSLVEIRLDLGRLVRRVVGLAVHQVVRLAVGARALVAARVGAVPVHRLITVLGDIHLLGLVDVGIKPPRTRTGTTGHQGLRQVIGRPQGSIIRIAVVVAIIAVCLRVSATFIEGSQEVFAPRLGRQLQPGTMDPCPLR